MEAAVTPNIVGTRLSGSNDRDVHMHGYDWMLLGTQVRMSQLLLSTLQTNQTQMQH